MSQDPIWKIRLSLKGRLLKSYTFAKDIVLIGRDPSCDICLDNPGVSRNHARLSRLSDSEYVVEDLDSTNGTFLNDEPVRRGQLRDQDTLLIGKFSLRVELESAARDATTEVFGHAEEQEDGTTVLTTDQLARVLKTSQQPEPAPQLGIVEPAADPDSASVTGERSVSFRVILWAAIALVLGIALGATLVFLK